MYLYDSALRVKVRAEFVNGAVSPSQLPTVTGSEHDDDDDDVEELEEEVDELDDDDDVEELEEEDDEDELLLSTELEDTLALDSLLGAELSGGSEEATDESGELAAEETTGTSELAEDDCVGGTDEAVPLELIIVVLEPALCAKTGLQLPKNEILIATRDTVRAIE